VVFEIHEALDELAGSLKGLRAATVLETSGIEVATWGEADFEVLTAEVAELWRGLASAEALALGTPESLEVRSGEGAWVVLPLAGDYLLAVLAGPGLPSGKARFYGREWVLRHRGDFA
jgi:predicted regulator of Ras-like GTPase activity (Roadblock/LC7/MglB family)